MCVCCVKQSCIYKTNYFIKRPFPHKGEESSWSAGLPEVVLHADHCHEPAVVSGQPRRSIAVRPSEEVTGDERRLREAGGPPDKEMLDIYFYIKILYHTGFVSSSASLCIDVALYCLPSELPLTTSIE